MHLRFVLPEDANLTSTLVSGTILWLSFALATSGFQAFAGSWPQSFLGIQICCEGLCKCAFFLSLWISRWHKLFPSCLIPKPFHDAHCWGSWSFQKVLYHEPRGLLSLGLEIPAPPPQYLPLYGLRYEALWLQSDAIFPGVCSVQKEENISFPRLKPLFYFVWPTIPHVW